MKCLQFRIVGTFIILKIDFFPEFFFDFLEPYYRKRYGQTTIGIKKYCNNKKEIK